jgi:hypothetical protein
LIDFSGALRGLPMDLFTKLFGDLLVFVLSLLRSHCHSWQAVTLREAMKLATAVKELGWREPKSTAPQSN